MQSSKDTSPLRRVLARKSWRKDEPEKKPAALDAAGFDKLEASLNELSKAAATQSLTYLLLWLYLFFTVTAVTDYDLLIENPIKLPIFNLEIGLLARFDDIVLSDGRRGPPSSDLATALTVLAAGATLILAPLLLYFGFQIRFLAYQSEGITWWHRGWVLAGLMLRIRRPPPVNPHENLHHASGRSRRRLWACTHPEPHTTKYDDIRWR